MTQRSLLLYRLRRRIETPTVETYSLRPLLNGPETSPSLAAWLIFFVNCANTALLILFLLSSCLLSLFLLSLSLEHHPNDITFGKITFRLNFSNLFASTYNELNATASLENNTLSVSPKSSIRILLLFVFSTLTIDEVSLLRSSHETLKFDWNSFVMNAFNSSNSSRFQFFHSSRRLLLLRRSGTSDGVRFLDRTGCGCCCCCAFFVPDDVLYACSLCFFFVCQHHLGQTDKKKGKNFPFAFVSHPSIFFIFPYFVPYGYGICDLSTPLKKKKREEKERERSHHKKIKRRSFFCLLVHTRETPPHIPQTAREHTHTQREREREREREKRGRALI